MSLITTEELAEILTLSPSTLETWRCQGYGPPWVSLRGKRGNVRYDSAKLEKWIESQTTHPGQAGEDGEDGG